MRLTWTAAWLLVMTSGCVLAAGNAQYRNPILYADYSDPDVIRSATVTT